MWLMRKINEKMNTDQDFDAVVNSNTTDRTNTTTTNTGTMNETTVTNNEGTNNVTTTIALNNPAAATTVKAENDDDDKDSSKSLDAFETWTVFTKEDDKLLLSTSTHSLLGERISLSKECQAEAKEKETPAVVEANNGSDSEYDGYFDDDDKNKSSNNNNNNNDGDDENDGDNDDVTGTEDDDIVVPMLPPQPLQAMEQKEQKNFDYPVLKIRNPNRLTFIGSTVPSFPTYGLMAEKLDCKNATTQAGAATGSLVGPSLSLIASADDISDGISIISDGESTERISPQPYTDDDDIYLHHTISEIIPISIDVKKYQNNSATKAASTEVASTYDDEDDEVGSEGEDTDDDVVEEEEENTSPPMQQSQIHIMTLPRDDDEGFFDWAGVPSFLPRRFTSILYMLLFFIFVTGSVQNLFNGEQKVSGKYEKMVTRLDELELQNNLMRAEIDIMAKQLNYLTSLSDQATNTLNKQAKGDYDGDNNDNKRGEKRRNGHGSGEKQRYNSGEKQRYNSGEKQYRHGGEKQHRHSDEKHHRHSGEKRRNGNGNEKTFKVWSGNGNSMKPIDITKEDLKRPYKCPDGNFVEFAAMCMEQEQQQQQEPGKANSPTEALADQIGEAVNEAFEKSATYQNIRKVTETLSNLVKDDKEEVVTPPLAETATENVQEQGTDNLVENLVCSDPRYPGLCYDPSSKSYVKNHFKYAKMDDFNSKERYNKHHRRHHHHEREREHDESSEHSGEHKHYRQQQQHHHKNNKHGDGKWHQDMMNEREQIRQQQQERERADKNWYIERGDDREHMRFGEMHYE